MRIHLVQTFHALIIALLAMVAVARAETPVQSPRDAATAFAAAVGAQDADAVAGLYLPQAIVLSPGSPAIAGRDAIRASWTANFAGGFRDLTFEDVQVDTGQDRAAVVWTWVGRIVQQGQPDQTLHGRSLVYLVLTPEGWLISADMWHPAP